MTPTLQGDEERHGLWQGINSATGERCKHYTNIQRVEALAMLHPLIEMGEGDGERLYLAASGATMHCGVTQPLAGADASEAVPPHPHGP